MKFRFTIGKKIGTGFGVLILLTLIVFVTTYITLQESREINDRISSVNQPSTKLLQELKTSVLETRLFLITWLKERKEHEDKVKLVQYQNEIYPETKRELEQLSKSWTVDQQDSLQKLFEDIEHLFQAQQNDVITILEKFEDYEEPMNLFFAENSMEAGGDIHYYYNEVLSELNELISTQKMYAQ